MFILNKTILKPFVVTKIVKKVVVYGISGLFCVVIGGYFVMAMIVKKDTSNDTKYIANIKNESQYFPISRINDGDLYNWCIKDDNDKISYDDFYLDRLTNVQRSMIFQFIPNGNPLDLFEMKQRAKRRLYDSNPVKDILNSGYDYYTTKSEPVLATAAGVVEFIHDGNQKYGYKNLVRIAHAHGFSTIYMNLDKVKVRKGDFVSKGDVLGLSVASPGKNHISLYYEVRFLNDDIDTSLFVNWDKQSFSSIFELNQSSDIDIKSLIWALNDIIVLNEEYMDVRKYNEWLKMAMQAKNEKFALVGARFNNINNGFIRDDEYNMTIIPQNIFNDSCRLMYDDRLVNNVDYFIINKFYAISMATAQKHFVMNFIPNGRPLQIPLRLSAPYGKRHHPILHIYRMHAGVDIIAPMNTPVYATADGIVDLAKSVDNGGYGKLVKIFHSFGFHTRYAHLNDVKVKRGEFVKKGQLIALTGSTGTSTGPHLHYEVRFLGQPIDPMNFVSWDMQNFNLIFDKERRVPWHSLLELINSLMGMRQM